jgi:hypothetical protein
MGPKHIALYAVIAVIVVVAGWYVMRQRGGSA